MSRGRPGTQGLCCEAARQVDREDSYMDEDQLQVALAEVDHLALDEYHESLTELAASEDRERAATQIGRLVGVILKEPFAKQESRTIPSQVTGAYWDWELRQGLNYDDPDLHAAWQYRVIKALLQEDWMKTEYGWLESVADFVGWAQYERGFFAFFSRSLRRYICGDVKLRQRLSQQVNRARRAGITLQVLTPQTLGAAGAVEVANILAANVPVLGFSGAALIGGIVFLLYFLGVESFCEWVDQRSAYQENN